MRFPKIAFENWLNDFPKKILGNRISLTYANLMTNLGKILRKSYEVSKIMPQNLALCPLKCCAFVVALSPIRVYISNSHHSRLFVTLVCHLMISITQHYLLKTNKTTCKIYTCISKPPKVNQEKEKPETGNTSWHCHKSKLNLKQ